MGEIIKELDDYGAKKGGSACLYRLGDAYYVISSIPAALDHFGSESLAFVADAEGGITDWTDVAGGRGRTREETIAELEEIGPDPESSGRGLFGDTKKQDERDAGEILAGTLSAMEVVARSLKP